LIIEELFYNKDYKFVSTILLSLQILFVFLLSLQRNISDVFDLKLTPSYKFVILFFLGLILCFVSVSIIRLESMKTILTLLLIVHIIVITFVMRADFLNYAGDIAGGGPNAKNVYYELSSQRSTLAQIRVHDGTAYRVWLTPEDNIQLIASQMYAYSLISLDPGKANCAQVKWASGSRSLLATFAEGATLSELEKIYLKPCGYSLLPIRMQVDHRDSSVKQTFGIIAT
jgi:hypothetical protein